jgi:hypothetical protein
MADDFISDIHCVISTNYRSNQRTVGACVRRRVRRENTEENLQWSLELYDFLDNGTPFISGAFCSYNLL